MQRKKNQGEGDGHFSPQMGGRNAGCPVPPPIKETPDPAEVKSEIKMNVSNFDYRSSSLFRRIPDIFY